MTYIFNLIPKPSTKIFTQLMGPKTNPILALSGKYLSHETEVYETLGLVWVLCEISSHGWSTSQSLFLEMNNNIGLDII